jgi:hypothetical protein
MKFRIAMVTGLALAWAGGAVAQQSGGRMDLDWFADDRAARLVSVRTTFEESTAVCPEERTLLTISNGLLAQSRHNAPLRAPTRGEHKAIDDETYRQQYRTNECRFDLLVRMQVLRVGSWVSLLVPRTRRPSLSAGERKKAFDESFAEARRRSESLSESLSSEQRRERSDRLRERQALGRSTGWIGTFSMGFGFEGASPNCFQAVGQFDLSSMGLTLSFPPNLPGDLNRFVIERADVDPYHARLYLVRDDCRFELSISKSVLHGDQWAAVPLAAIPPPRGQQRELPPEKL